MANSIAVIFPYRYQGMWVFDDERAGLLREPFVSGADTLIDMALEYKSIKNAEDGFKIIFSAGEFPGYEFKFTWLREGEGGNWYYSEDFKMEGWLCPALFAYFDHAPEVIYTKFEEKS